MSRHAARLRQSMLIVHSFAAGHTGGPGNTVSGHRTVVLMRGLICSILSTATKKGRCDDPR
ncbi:hypothetical protein ACFFX0_07010 [Citricoccus parietis]|uniref:Uncharacterized protein n=1 Tax=Citricoccus parietis TaxID=592307 RepID=A0ABV5FWZ1_9MICC